ncbi:MAG: hypothetical protein JNK67_18670 [Alphaproteobacteria bacterium]|nr:hypothetical protein [Alphaproteobacteria bacterium]
MPAPSALFFIATAAASTVAGGVGLQETNQPAWFGSSVRIEKLYTQGDKVVATPILSVAEANEKCPKGYAVRREGREQRGADVYLTWTLNCY